MNIFASGSSDHSADVGEPEKICSAKGCRAQATHAVLWNNPRVHTPERRKTWLACNEHQESLSSFVAMRGFLIEVVPVEQIT